jgi:hypothetical protein
MKSKIEQHLVQYSQTYVAIAEAFALIFLIGLFFTEYLK